ncbi:MAG: hypothetical protein ACI4R9_04660 [Kiritimatiellia bacterium]
MEEKGLAKSGAFAAIVLLLVAVLLPFAVEQIGEATGAFRFPASGFLRRAFTRGAPAPRKGSAAHPAGWERCRQALEEFARWAEGCDAAAICLPPAVVERIAVKEEAPRERAVWLPAVAACTPGGGAGDARDRGYLFLTGFERPFPEGAVIAPSQGLCGYEILDIGERTIWLRVIGGEEDAHPVGAVRLPEFTHIDGESLVRGTRVYVARDAFPIPSGGWLLLDSFMPPSGALFKILDRNRRVAASLVCVVIGGKGGK